MLNNDDNSDEYENGEDNTAAGFFIARKHRIECMAHVRSKSLEMQLQLQVNYYNIAAAPATIRPTLQTSTPTATTAATTTATNY